MKRTPRILTIACLAALVALPAVSTPALAQENAQATASQSNNDAPLRIAFVNAAAKNGEDVFETFDNYFLSSTNIERIDPNKVLEVAERYGLTLKDFRSGKTRKKRAADFKSVINDLRAETLFILDVYGKGRKTQLVALDHNGNEISDERKNIRRGKIKSKDAEKMAYNAFKKIVPAVQAFRAEGGYPPEQPVDNGPPEDAEPGNYVPPPPTAAAPETDESDEDPNEPSGVFFADALFLYNSNSILIENSDNDRVEYKASSIGGGLSIGSKFVSLGDYVTLGVTGMGGYSPFKTTILNTTTNEKTDRDSYLAFGQLQFNVHIEATDDFFITPFVGGDYRTLHVDEDPGLDFYGFSLIGLRGGVMFNYAPGDLDLGLSAAAVPSFKTDFFPETYGDPEFTMSYEGRFTVSYRVWSFLRLTAGYDFRYTMTSFKSAEGVFKDHSAPDYTDMSHMAFGGVGVIF